MVGDPGVEVGGAVAAGAEEELGRGLGAALGGEELVVLGVLGDVGGEVFEHSGSEHLQLAGPELGGFGDEQRLGLGQQVITEVGGQGLEGVGDHAGLGEVDLPGGERGGGLGPPLVERGRQR